MKRHKHHALDHMIIPLITFPRKSPGILSSQTSIPTMINPKIRPIQ